MEGVSVNEHLWKKCLAVSVIFKQKLNMKIDVNWSIKTLLRAIHLHVFSYSLYWLFVLVLIGWCLTPRKV